MKDFKGAASTKLKIEDLKRIGWDAVSEYQKVKIFGRVEEQFTKIEFNNSIEMELIVKKIRVIIDDVPIYMKPGLQYVAYVSSDDVMFGV